MLNSSTLTHYTAALSNDGNDDQAEAVDLYLCTTVCFTSTKLKRLSWSAGRWSSQVTMLGVGDGKDSKDSKDGKDGKDCKDIRDGKDGKDGKDGNDGKDGKDSKDGKGGKG